MSAKKAAKKEAKKAAKKSVRGGPRRPPAGTRENPKPAGSPPPSPVLLESPGGGWEIVRATPELAGFTTRGGRSSRTAADLPGGKDVVMELLADPQIEELDRIEARPATGRRSKDAAGSSMVPLAVTVPAEAAVLLVVRQESGAISFHRPTAMAATRRSGGAGAMDVRVNFEVPAQDSAEETGRRGPLSKIIRAVLVKIADKLVGELAEHAAEWIVPKLALAAEKKLWEKRTSGWLQVTQDGLAAEEDRLAAGKPAFPENERGLLFIHGTFSTTHGGFGNLAGTGFFKEAKKIYGTNFFAFNHFTFSRTTEENVKDLLDGLPDRDFEFDIITHSRGGLVARELLEGSGLNHPKRGRLKIGKVIMVACPNIGTPLAGEKHWDRSLSLFANVMELLPENPFTTGAAWLTEALKWFATNALGNCPGLSVMDPDSEYIGEIQEPPDAPGQTLYHALVSNFRPPRNWLARLGDLGVDAFFGGANDLVVPTEGGWKTADQPEVWIPPQRIACFGLGGNLAADAGVHHGGFFGNAEAVSFMVNRLKGEPTTLAELDTAARLPLIDFKSTRGGTRAGPTSGPTGSADRPDEGSPEDEKREATTDPKNRPDYDPEEELSLTVVSNNEFATVDKEAAGRSVPILIARYGSARVAVPFYTSGENESAGKRWQKIIGDHKRLVSYANGENVEFPGPPGETDSPGQTFLEDFGHSLFQTLFPTEVRNLYNVARFLHRKRRLKITFTSMIPWVADIPWEFAYDRSANSFLSCGDVRFVRNVLTPTPTNQIDPKQGPLRILVVSAQPSGLGRLSIEEESRGIHESFRPLIDAGLVEVEVLASATPGLLHERLRYQMDGDEFDVLHFIGHGEFDEAARTGYLIFQDEAGRPHRLSATAFLNIVQARNIRIVFLNACETGRGAKADYNRGVAMALVQDGIPAVVANQYSVIDRSASLFSLHFYSCLARGLNLGDAMREARIAMHYCGVERIDWGVPVLFATNPDSRVCTRTSRPAFGSAAPAPAFNVLSRPATTTRGGTGTRPKTVAVWDAENSLVYRENLQGTLNEFNRAQDRFVFQLERFSAPRSLWSVDHDPQADGIAYLRAEKVIPRMRHILKAIGSDFLFCVTGLPLRDDQTTALYYYSDDDEADNNAARQVTILSIWALNPPLEGGLLKKAIANHVAISLLEGLSGVSSGGETDDDPAHPIHTIGFFNDQRLVDHIAGKMTITDPTVKLIEKKIVSGKFAREDFEAIQKLLCLFQPG
jgi:hypothetical protein